MKLILTYIPKPLNSNNSSQQDYIRKINKIIDEFFNEIKEEDSNIKDNISEEINYNLYLTKVTEGINDKALNGAFFLFINLLKYIFQNIPFNKETIDAVNYAKNKHLLKVSIPALGSVKNINNKFKKSLFKSEAFSSSINNNINNNINNYINNNINNNNIENNNINNNIEKNNSIINNNINNYKLINNDQNQFTVTRKKEKNTLIIKFLKEIMH